MRLKLKKPLWLVLQLSLSACGALPKAPQFVQYGVQPNLSRPGFYGVDNPTKAHIYKPFTDPSMKGAQCLTPADYLKWARWIEQVKVIADKKCAF